MQKRAAEAKRKAKQEAAKQRAKEREVAEREAAEKEAAEAAVKEPASTSIRAHAAASPEVTGAPRVKQEDETNDEAASAAAGSRILAGVASGAAGVGGTLKSGAMTVLGMMSPTLSAKKEPETIELLDDSDDEAAKQQAKDIEQERVAAKKEAKRLAREAEHENYGLDDEDLIVPEDVEGLSYADLRHHCKIRHLPATGKAEVLRKRLVEHLRKEEPTDEATAAEKARMLEQERQFQEEAELQRLEQERIASKKEAKRLGLEQQELLAREAEREQAGRKRIASNREFLSRAKKRREAEEARQRDVEAKMQKRAAEAKRKAEKEAAKQRAKEREAAEREAAEKEAAEAAVKEPASTSIRAHAAASPEVTVAPRVKQEDETNDEAASAAAGSRILAGVASGAAGVGGTLKSGAMTVLGMMSPTLSAKKEPETIELLDDSDDEAAKEQAKDAVKESENAVEDEDEGIELTDERIDSLTYRQLQHECIYRGLPAHGKTEVLKDRLRWALQQSLGTRATDGTEASVKQEDEEEDTPSSVEQQPSGDGKPSAIQQEDATDPQGHVQNKQETIHENAVEEDKIELEAEDALSIGSVASMSYRELQSACKSHGLPAGGKGDVLRKRLQPLISGGGNEPIAEGTGARTSSTQDQEATSAASQPAARAPAASSAVGGGLLSVMKEGAKSAFEMFSPTAKKPETIELLDDSDDDIEVVAKPPAPTATSVKEEYAGADDNVNDSKSVLTAQDIDGWSYRQLQNECKARGMGAKGKAADLKERLMSTIGDGKQEIPESIGRNNEVASPMSSIASTPDRGAFRARSRTTPSSAISSLGPTSSGRRGRAVARTGATEPLPVVNEEAEGYEEGKPVAAAAHRRGRRKRDANEESSEGEGAEHDAAKPSPPKKQRRKAAATPSSSSSRATTRSRATRGSARSTRSKSSYK